MVDENLLEGLLERWEDARDEGTPLTPEELCQDHPNLLNALTQRIHKLLAVDSVLSLKETATRAGGVADDTPDIPGYEIVQQLASGGMGAVYEARHQMLSTTRAIKVALSRWVSTASLERFRREMTVQAQFEHEHILPVYEAGLLGDGKPYFVMPLIRGGNLKDRLPQYQADPRAGTALMVPVCRAVYFAHTKGIVHRDLKPGNILLTAEGKPLVADFGIVKLLSEEPDLPTYSTERTAHKPLPHPETTVVRLTRVGTIIGTWAYLSPEAVTGQTDRVGPRSDVWALGVILYQMLTGAYPFPGQEPAEITTQILDAEPEAPGGDPTLARIVMRCLRKEQADRYPSAAALADDLEAWVNGRPPRGVPASRGYWLRWQVRRWWRAAASVLLLLSVGVARSWDAVAGQISCPGRWTS